MGRRFARPIVRVSPAGIALIKSYESCRLTPYLCSSGVPTIGWGHTGPDAQQDKPITQLRADQLLSRDIGEAEMAVNRLITVPLSQNRFDALVSFVFNVGAGALERSSLRRRLNAHEDPDTVAAQELPRFVKGDSDQPVPGLVRRRNEELKLFLESPALPLRDLRARQDTWLKKRPIDSSKLAAGEKSAVAEGRSFPQTRILVSLGQRQGGHTQVELPGGAGQWWLFDQHWDGLVDVPHNNPLQGVPYFYQLDNGPEGWRQCQSSSIAMALKFLGIQGFRDDADYAELVSRYGDTTERQPHYDAMKKLGYTGAQFFMTLSETLIKKEIDRGKPVAVGALHKGPPSAPRGGGHFVLIYGYDATGWRVHDPHGSQDLLNGGFMNTTPSAGKAQHYSYRNFSPRIFVGGPNDGWGWTFR